MADNNIKLLLRSLLGPTQDVENALQQLFYERGVDTAVGEQLDVLGRVVGQLRNGMVDADYRRLIRARISVNRSKGTIADILKVAGLVIDDNLAYLHVDNTGIASLRLIVEDVILDWGTAELTIKMLRDTVAGGVRIILEFWQVAESGMFEFDTYVPGGGTGLGFDTYVPGSGGSLASALE